jgi:putative ABC transport system substrate-binding protein
MMRVVRRIVLAVLLVGSGPTVGDEPTRLPTVGLAIPVDAEAAAPFEKAFQEGLRQLGWVDGTNIRLIRRYSNGDPARYRELIRELIALRVDVLWGEARELKEATTTIPIVSPRMPDPVKTGLVASLARPGGNVTGVSLQGYDLEPKTFELVIELLPQLRRLCVLFSDNHDSPDLVSYVQDMYRERAHSAGISVCTIPLRTLNDVHTVPKIIEKERPQAIIAWSSTFVVQHRLALIPPIAKRLPVIGDGREVAELGAVLTYFADWMDMFRHSAAYVDKILKGAKPGDLPIEQPTKFNLVVNLKAAKGLGIKVPESILVRADEIIR